MLYLLSYRSIWWRLRCPQTDELERVIIIAALTHMVSAIGFEPMHKSVMSWLPYHLAKRTGLREVSLSDRKGFYQWTSHRALSSWCLERDSNPHLMDFKSSASAVGLPRHLTGARSIAPERWFRRPPNYERRWFRLCCFFFLFCLSISLSWFRCKDSVTRRHFATHTLLYGGANRQLSYGHAYKSARGMICTFVTGSAVTVFS